MTFHHIPAPTQKLPGCGIVRAALVKAGQCIPHPGVRHMAAKSSAAAAGWQSVRAAHAHTQTRQRLLSCFKAAVGQPQLPGFGMARAKPDSMPHSRRAPRTWLSRTGQSRQVARRHSTPWRANNPGPHTQGRPPSTAPVRFLDAAGGGRGLARGLGGQLLARRLAASGLARGLLRAGHGCCSGLSG